VNRVAHFILFLALALPLHAAALAPDEVKAVADEAAALFRQANETVTAAPDKATELYGKAALRYERIIREGGIENGELYYNIGNAYFRMKDIGRAILNYRKAERYLPNDVNLLQNLAHARTMKRDAIAEPQRRKVLRTLFFWHYDLGTVPRGRLFAIFFLATWSLAGVRLYVRRSALTAGAVTGAAVSLLLAASLWVSAIGVDAHREGVILGAEVHARKGDSTAYERSFTEPLHAGTEFRLLEDRGEWYRIELGDTRTCWVPAADVGLVQ